MEIAQHIAILEQEAKILGEAARQAELNTEIPTCPGWAMRDLVRHLAEIHLWAAAQVSNRATKMWVDDVSELADYWPELAVFWPDDEALIDWYLETNANLVRALEAASPDDDIPTFLPAPSPLAMWARRQAHETAIHRFDAQHAADIESGFDPVFASDGIDELVTGFATRAKDFPTADPRTMLIHASDTGDRWHLTLAPDGITAARSDGPADVTLLGEASDLNLVLWNRGEDSTITVEGDGELLDLWHASRRVRWF